MNELNLEAIEVIEIIGEKSGAAGFYPDDWLIFNAQRPILGSLIEFDVDIAGMGARVQEAPVTWSEPGYYGRFFAAVDPADKRAQELIDFNGRLDARLLQWVSIRDHSERVMKWAADQFGAHRIEGINFEDIDNIYRNRAERRIYG